MVVMMMMMVLMMMYLRKFKKGINTFTTAERDICESNYTYLLIS